MIQIDCHTQNLNAVLNSLLVYLLVIWFVLDRKGSNFSWRAIRIIVPVVPRFSLVRHPLLPHFSQSALRNNRDCVSASCGTPYYRTSFRVCEWTLQTPFQPPSIPTFTALLSERVRSQLQRKWLWPMSPNPLEQLRIPREFFNTSIASANLALIASLLNLRHKLDSNTYPIFLASWTEMKNQRHANNN